MSDYILDAKRLRECREKMGYSKIEAAKKIGISQPAYLRYESGERTPSLQVIKEIAEVFQTSPDYLIGRTNSSQVMSYTVYESENPELFLLVDKYRKADKEQLTRLLAYLEKFEQGGRKVEGR